MRRWPLDRLRAAAADSSMRKAYHLHLAPWPDGEQQPGATASSEMQEVAAGAAHPSGVSGGVSNTPGEALGVGGSDEQLLTQLAAISS